MYSLVYLSVAPRVMQQEELIEILEQSKTWNKDHNLTGCLAYIEGKIKEEYHCRFIQVVEGSEHDVVSVFKKIQKDTRHKEVTVIKQGQIKNRNFGDWEMGFEKISLGSNSTLLDFFKLDLKLLANDGDISNNMLLNFMKSFYKQL
jgi:hypothetical protein